MKHLQWDRLVMPVAGVVLGLFLIARPWNATAALCSFIGWLILLAGISGIVNALAFQRATFISSPLLPLSVGAAVIGFFLILSPGVLVSLVGTIVCVFLLVTGLSNIQAAMARRAWGDRAWWVPLAVGVICVLLGLYALFAPGASAAMVMRLVGIMILCSSAVNLFSVLTWRD